MLNHRFQKSLLFLQYRISILLPSLFFKTACCYYRATPRLEPTAGRSSCLKITEKTLKNNLQEQQRRRREVRIISFDFLTGRATSVQRKIVRKEVRQEGKRKEGRKEGRNESIFFLKKRKKTAPLARRTQPPPPRPPLTRRQCPSKLRAAPHENIIALLRFLTSCLLACEL